MNKHKSGKKSTHKQNKIGKYLWIAIVAIVIFVFYLQYKQSQDPGAEGSATLVPRTSQTETQSIDPPTNSSSQNIGSDAILAEGEGLELVKANCTSCHSAKLIVQNRATREGWLNMIRWMQQTQNLWDLGENEELILDYLSTYYPPEEKGRRENLKDIEWYEME